MIYHDCVSDVKPKKDIVDTKSQVLSLAKGFRVLEAFDSDERELTLSQIAARAGLDAGTTFRQAPIVRRVTARPARRSDSIRSNSRTIAIPMRFTVSR